MRKKYVYLVLGFLCIGMSYSQFCLAQSYDFSTSQSTYQPLTNTTVVSAANWDSEDYILTSEINTSFFYKSYSTVTITDDAEISFSDFIEQDRLNIIAADLEQHATRTPSELRYVVEGTIPNRILKIEWVNAGFYNDPTEQAYANFQVWLNEGNGVVSILFGESSGVLPDFLDNQNPLIELSNQDISARINLTGPPANPTVIKNDASEPTLESFPTSGQVYTFTPKLGTLVLNSPSGGEEWETGQTQTITWTATDVLHVNLEYAIGDTGQWREIATELDATTQSYTWTIPGLVTSDKYRIRVLDDVFPVVGDTTNTDLTITNIFTSIGDALHKQLQVEVFPNPSNGLIHWQWAGNVHEASRGNVRVTDMQGREQITRSIQESDRLDLRALPAGMYLVTFEFKDYLPVVKRIVIR